MVVETKSGLSITIETRGNFYRLNIKNNSHTEKSLIMTKEELEALNATISSFMQDLQITQGEENYGI